MKKIVLLSFLVVFACSVDSRAQIITTIAGNGVAGFGGDAGTATSAELNGPFGVAVDGAGNKYIIDQQNQRIRKVNTAGVITTIAGTGTAGFSGDSSAATGAELNFPSGIAADASGNVYIADQKNNRIRKIDNSGVITTIAGSVIGFSGDNGPAVSARLNNPTGVAVDSLGNIYIADMSNGRIRKINTSGIITTIAGSGSGGYNGDNWPSAVLADLSQPTAVAADNMGNVYIADLGNQRIRKVDTFNKISTIFGDGTAGFTPDGTLATISRLSSPNGVAVDGYGNVYVSDENNYRIRKIDHNYGTILTIAGTGVSGYNGDSASALSTKIGKAKGVAVDNDGNVYFADWGNNRVDYVTSTVSVKAVNENISGINIYPNPNKGSFTVNITSANNEPAHLVITNVMGQKVREMNIVTNNPVILGLDIANGVYSVSVIAASGKWSGMVEINRP